MESGLSAYIAGLSRRVCVIDVGKSSAIMIPDDYPHHQFSLLVADLCTGSRLKFGPNTSCDALFSSAG